MISLAVEMCQKATLWKLEQECPHKSLVGELIESSLGADWEVGGVSLRTSRAMFCFYLSICC